MTRITIKLCLVFSVLIIAVFIYCAINPVTGQRELMLLSESEEAALGRETDRSEEHTS